MLKVKRENESRLDIFQIADSLRNEWNQLSAYDAKTKIHVSYPTIYRERRICFVLHGNQNDGGGHAYVWFGTIHLYRPGFRNETHWTSTIAHEMGHVILEHEPPEHELEDNKDQIAADQWALEQLKSKISSEEYLETVILPAIRQNEKFISIDSKSNFNLTERKYKILGILP